MNFVNDKCLLLPDDVSSFNMSYFCKFQPVTRACENRRMTHKYVEHVIFKLKPNLESFCSRAYEIQFFR